MKPAKRPRCLCCKNVFDADPRNARHQKYCSAPMCRLASKAASQRRWLDKPENLNYHRGAPAVARVREWQAAHPEYRERQRARRLLALQDLCAAQVLDFEEESAIAAISDEMPGAPVSPALQDFIATQPLVFVGLIAHFFNITLQDDIANTARSLQKLGEDIANGRGAHGVVKGGDFPRAVAAGAASV
jgi:hypothetical protein